MSLEIGLFLFSILNVVSPDPLQQNCNSPNNLEGSVQDLHGVGRLARCMPDGNVSSYFSASHNTLKPSKAWGVLPEVQQRKNCDCYWERQIREVNCRRKGALNTGGKTISVTVLGNGSYRVYFPQRQYIFVYGNKVQCFSSKDSQSKLGKTTPFLINLSHVPLCLCIFPIN